jgi:hypothetical protein
MEDIVWKSTLDGRYEVIVTRTGDYMGDLSISNENKVLFSQPVGLSYGAIFGPDIDDVASWQEIAINFIDGNKE